MSHIITLAIIFAVYYFYHVYKASVEEKEAEEDRFFEELKNSGKDEEEREIDAVKCLDDRTTTGLVTSTLRKIGCDYEIEQRGDNNWIRSTFLGEHFTIDCNDGYKFIDIYDTWWYEISTYSDVEEIADLHRIINRANEYVNCTLIYAINKEAEQIGVYSKKNMLFISQIPELDLYLKSGFNELFKAQRFVLTELEKCKVAENK